MGVYRIGFQMTMENIWSLVRLHPLSLKGHLITPKIYYWGGIGYKLLPSWCIGQ
jgi:hypothetical protein